MTENNLFKQQIDFINKYQNFLIFGHEEPDGDSVGSGLALVHWLKRLGKGAQAFVAGAFEKLEILAYQTSFKTTVEPADIDTHTAVIIADCSALNRTGLPIDLLTSLPSLVIDHHAEGHGDGDVRYIEPHSPSTTLLVQRLMEEYGNPPDQAEAELLLLGFCTDTGFFRHLDKEQGRVLTAVARLIETGVSLQNIYARMYWGKELKQAKLLGLLLTRVESYDDQKVLLTWQNHTDYEDDGSTKLRVSDDLYRYLQSIKNNEVVVFIKEKSATECSVSLRSTHDFNVAKLAKSLGGGGHHHAAGINLPGTAGELKKIILKELSQFFKI